MEYRLVIKASSADLFTESSTELLYSLIRKRHLIARNKILVLDKGVEAKSTFFSRRKWKIIQGYQTIAQIRFAFFGKKVKIILPEETYLSSLVHDKLYFREKNNLKTGIVYERMKSSQFLRISHAEYFDPLISSILGYLLILLKRI